MVQTFDLSFLHESALMPVFAGVSLALNAGEKVALVGPNGCGKSTLMRLLLGELEPTSGRVVLESGLRMRLVRQDHEFCGGGTLRESLLDEAGLLHLHAALSSAENRVGAGDTDALDALSDALEAWELARGAEREAQLAEAVAGLGLAERMNDDYSQLSYGERARASLAAALASDADLLLLDEPTNHLDIRAREWLADALLALPKTVLMVCHDRALVDAVADRVLELGSVGVRSYAGGYSAMREAKAAEFERQQQAWEAGRDEVRRLKNASERLLQKASTMTARPTGRTYDPKAKAFYAGKEARMDRRAKAVRQRASAVQAEASPKPFVAQPPRLALQTLPIRSPHALDVTGLALRVGDRDLVKGLSFCVPRRGRVALIGPNGTGKTTLLRAVCGELQPVEGTVRLGSGVKPGYLSQSRSVLESSLPLLAALDAQAGERADRARSLLGHLGLGGQRAFRKVGELSTGERTKAELVALMLSRANFLVLDEPTNHLDVESLEALERALDGFDGAVLFASHDRAFVDQVATDVVDLGL